jgi:hypothetical protein
VYEFIVMLSHGLEYAGSGSRTLGRKEFFGGSPKTDLREVTPICRLMI